MHTFFGYSQLGDGCPVIGSSQMESRRISSSSSNVLRDNGPHLRNERTTEKWAYGRFNTKLGIEISD